MGSFLRIDLTTNYIRVILPAMDYTIEGRVNLKAEALDSGGDREDPLSPGESRSSRPLFKTYIPDAEDLAFSCGEVPPWNHEPDAVEQWAAILDQLQDAGFYVIEISAEP
jgi:hypothetical protein